MNKLVQGRVRSACDWLSTAALATVLVASAQASEGEVEDSAGFALEEIIVTATKRRESVQDVPIAVSVLGAADIQARGYSQFSDYVDTLPGVYLDNGGPGKSDIRIRGIVATGGSGGEVATYFGETVTSVLTDLGGKPNLRLVDIERVEVMRGPQGTLFGANALTGVVRFVPAAPDLREFEVHLGTRGFATAHSDDLSHQVEGTFNIPLLQDRLALRLVAYQEQTAGYIDNIVAARDAVDYSDAFGAPAGTLVIPGNPAFTRKDNNSEDAWGARAALRWQASDRLLVDLSYATQDVTLDSTDSLVTPAVGQYAQERPIDFFELGRSSEKIDVGNLVVTYNRDEMSLTSVTSLVRLKTAEVLDLSPIIGVALGLPPVPWVSRELGDGQLFTQEVRLQSQGEDAFQWILGAFYMEQELDGTQFIADHSCPTCLPTVVLGQDFALRIAPGADPRTFNQEQRSLFGEVSYRFLPRWTVGVGGRYLEDTIENLRAAYEGIAVDPGDGVADPTPLVDGTTYELNPSAYLRFKPADDMTLYVQAARGFRSGVANQPLSYTGDCAQEAAAIGLGPLSDPDSLWSYEFGVKSQLAQGRVALNAAVYKQEWKDVQLGSNMECGFNGTYNAGDVTGEGVEVELTAQLARDWRVNLAAAYTHNEFDRLSPNVELYRVGERISGAPEKNASAGVQYDFSVNSRWSGFARADYVYVGSVRNKFAADLVLDQAGYSTAGLRVGLRRDRVAVELFGRNLTDKAAVVSTADPTFGGSRFMLLRPREIGIEARYSFN